MCNKGKSCLIEQRLVNLKVLYLTGPFFIVCPSCLQEAKVPAWAQREKFQLYEGKTQGQSVNLNHPGFVRTLIELPVWVSGLLRIIFLSDLVYRYIRISLLILRNVQCKTLLSMAEQVQAVDYFFDSVV